MQPIFLGQITGELTVIGDAQIVYIDDVSSAKVVLTDGVYTLNKGIVQQKSVKPKIEKGRTEESKSEKIAVQKVKKQSKESKLIASRKIVPKEFIHIPIQDQNISLRSAKSNGGCVVLSLHGCALESVPTFHLINHKYNMSQEFTYSSGHIRYLLSYSYTSRPPPFS